MTENLKVDAIIPAYNEGSTIDEIVRMIATHPQINKVVVVNDGSSDETVQIIEDLIKEPLFQGKVLLVNQKNSGKTKAVEVGFDKTASPIILMLDADLIGLTHDHISVLIDPVLKDEVDMTIGLFTSGRFITDLAHRTNRNLSGQRAMKKKCLEAVDWENTKNFGLESHLTGLIKNNDWKVEYVDLEGMTHRMKTEKRGFWQGWKARLQMYWQILLHDWARDTGWSKIFKKNKKE